VPPTVTRACQVAVGHTLLMQRGLPLCLAACVAGTALLVACGTGGAGSTHQETAAATPGTAPPGSSGAFTALTYNVAGLPQGVNADQHPQDNQPVMSPLLNAYDVVLLQEDFGFYTDLLRADLTHGFESEPHPGPVQMNPIAREGAVVGDGLNVVSRLPIGDLERVPWMDCGAAAGDCLALKGFAATELTVADGATVDLYDLHMEAGSGTDDDRLRGDDLRDLAAYIDAHSAGEAVIVGGDWNLSFDDEPDASQLHRFLRDTGLSDVCDVVDCGADADVIDRFLFRSADNLTLEPTSHVFAREMFVDAAGGPLSDHDPLAVDWSWST